MPTEADFEQYRRNLSRMSHNGETAQRSYKGYTHAGGIDLKPSSNVNLPQAGYVQVVGDIPHLPPSSKFVIEEFMKNIPTTDPTMQSTPTKFKYREKEFLDSVIKYVEGTYDQHYAGKNNVQTIDVWEALGSAETTARDTAIKYLMRYGKKDGYNKKDLLKAVHYITLLNFFSEQRQMLEDSRKYSNTVLNTSDPRSFVVMDSTIPHGIPKRY